MKKLWISLFLFMVVLSAGVVFFLVRFDIHRLTPRLEKDLEWFAGSPVKIGRLTLRWQDGLVLEITQLKFLSADKSSGEEALLSIERVKARLDLLPLLAGKVSVATVVFERPHFSVRHLAGQGFRLEGIDTPAMLERISAPVKTVGRFLSFSVRKIVLEKGSVRWMDESGGEIMTFAEASATLEEKKGAGGMQLMFQASVLSKKQNFKVDALVGWNPARRAFNLSDGKAELDLNALPLKSFETRWPILQRLSFQDKIEGVLGAEIRELEIARWGIGRFDVTVGLKDGKLQIPQLATAIDQIRWNVLWDNGQIELQSFTANLAGGEIQMSGRIQLTPAGADSDIEVQGQNLALEDFLPPISAEEPQLHGRLTGEFRAKSKGKDPAGFIQNLAGEGRFFIKDAVYVHRNGLEYTLKQLEMIPDLMKTVKTKLPEPLKNKLERSDTVLEPLEQVFRLKADEISLDDFRFASEVFESSGKITAKIPVRVTGQVELKVSNEMSSALAAAEPRLSAFFDSNGQIRIPLILEGDMLRIQSHPDRDKMEALLKAQKSPLKTKASEAANQAFNTAFLDQFIESATKTKQPSAAKAG